MDKDKDLSDFTADLIVKAHNNIEQAKLVIELVKKRNQDKIIGDVDIKKIKDMEEIIAQNEAEIKKLTGEKPN